jgi:hypothetical protein
VGVGGRVPGHLGGARVVGVLAAGRHRDVVLQAEPPLQLRSAGGEVAERQDVVGPGLLEPQRLELLHLVGMLVGQVVGFGAVAVGVEQLPAVLVEAALAQERAVLGHGLPALVPDPAGAEHLVVLGLLAGRPVGLEGIRHRDPRQR